MLLLFAALALMATPEFAAGQIPFESSTGPIPYNGQYNRGQDVVPSYDGWKANPDGTLSMFFGYMNRNYEEQLDIDIAERQRHDGGAVGLLGRLGGRSQDIAVEGEGMGEVRDCDPDMSDPGMIDHAG